MTLPAFLAQRLERHLAGSKPVDPEQLVFTSPDGWSPVEIAARLGHEKATVTTKFYARRVVGRDVEIADRLDGTFRGTTSDSSGHAEGTRGLRSLGVDAGEGV